MAWDWKNIKESASKALSDIGSQIDKTIESTSTYVQTQVMPEISKFGSDAMEATRNLGNDVKAGINNFQMNASSRISDWCQNGKANNIPWEYTDIVKKALVAAAAAGPLGVTGGVADTIAIAGIWTTMFLAIRSKANNVLFGKDPKRIAGGVATGIVKYYIGCKLATYACFLIPGAGIFAGMSVSAVCNVYFTYSFASVLIEVMDTKLSYSDDDIIKEVISLIKKMPSPEEIKEIVYIYQY